VHDKQHWFDHTSFKPTQDTWTSDCERVSGVSRAKCLLFVKARKRCRGVFNRELRKGSPIKPFKRSAARNTSGQNLSISGSRRSPDSTCLSKSFAESSGFSWGRLERSAPGWSSSQKGPGHCSPRSFEQPPVSSSRSRGRLRFLTAVNTVRYVWPPEIFSFTVHHCEPNSFQFRW
jgi:hypothetical protein